MQLACDGDGVVSGSGAQHLALAVLHVPAVERQVFEIGDGRVADLAAGQCHRRAGIHADFGERAYAVAVAVGHGDRPLEAVAHAIGPQVNGSSHVADVEHHGAQVVGYGLKPFGRVACGGDDHVRPRHRGVFSLSVHVVYGQADFVGGKHDELGGGVVGIAFGGRVERIGALAVEDAQVGQRKRSNGGASSHQEGAPREGEGGVRAIAGIHVDGLWFGCARTIRLVIGHSWPPSVLIDHCKGNRLGTYLLFDA